MLSLKMCKEKYLAHELLIWKLKSIIKWLELGDAHTKLFHSHALACNNFNSIWALKNEEGRLGEETIHLKELGVKHFTESFKDDGKSIISDQLKVIQLFPSFVTRDEASIFIDEVTLVEVEGALKDFKRDQSPSPDG